MTPTAQDATARHGAGARQDTRDLRSDGIRVAGRHGIWTVTSSGVFVGDYHDPQVALAAAAQVRHRGHGGGKAGDMADPWHRSATEMTP